MFAKQLSSIDEGIHLYMLGAIFICCQYDILVLKKLVYWNLNDLVMASSSSNRNLGRKNSIYCILAFWCQPSPLVLFTSKMVVAERLMGVHNTTKAWENAYVVGSKPYSLNDNEQRKRKHWLKVPVLGLCQKHDYFGMEVRYTSNMVLKHSQKGR